MKPMGRKPLNFPGKADCHPRGELRNWWEVEAANDENKKGDRQQAKRDIEKAIIEETS